MLIELIVLGGVSGYTYFKGRSDGKRKRLGR